MTGAEYVDWLIEIVGSELTRSKAHNAINNAQNIIFRMNHPLMEVVPHPFLTTVAGSTTYVYTASNSFYSSAGGAKGATQYDIRNVHAIYSFNNDRTIFAYNDEDLVSERPYRAFNHYASAEVHNSLDVVKSLEPNNSDCKFTWWEDNDPGATTVDWRGIVYRWPTQFTGEGVSLEVPVGFQETLLLYHILRNLGIRQYGNPSAPIDNLIRQAEAEFYQYSHTGAKSRPNRRLPAEV
jgi:hypothetical protein